MIWLRFSTSNKIGSRLIRWFTFSDWSHVDFVLPNGLLLGSRWPDGVAVRDRDPSERELYCRVDCPVSDAVLAYAHEQLGKRYDSTGIVGIALRRPFASESRWFCSELVAASFAHAGHPLVLGHYSRITPRDLLLSPRVIQCPEIYVGGTDAA
jgi:hypothetical protein